MLEPSNTDLLESAIFQSEERVADDRVLIAQRPLRAGGIADVDPDGVCVAKVARDGLVRVSGDGIRAVDGRAPKRDLWAAAADGADDDVRTVQRAAGDTAITVIIVGRLGRRN